MIIGPGVLGLVHESHVLHSLAQLGVLILLFEVGLESDLGDLLRVGLQATLVTLVGVAVPFALGYGLMHGLGHHSLMAVFVGAALTATSVGITARVLAAPGRLQDAADKAVLGAAVVTGIAQTGHVAGAAIGLLSTKAVLFLVVAILAGIRRAPVLVGWIGSMAALGALIVYSVVFAWTSSHTTRGIRGRRRIGTTASCRSTGERC